MFRFGLLAMTLLVGALFTGCSNDCSTAFDCAADEVCYQQVCTPATASYLTCSGDDDCNGDDESGLFECRGGRCILVDSTGAVADSGTGSADASSQDAGPADTGTSTTTLDAGE